jgi:hypothetical protein
MKRGYRVLTPYELDGILSRWARMRGIDIGRHHYNGLALFAEDRPGMQPALVIERRGPDWPAFRIEFTYAGHGRGRLYRQTAIQQAERLLTALQSVMAAT